MKYIAAILVGVITSMLGVRVFENGQFNIKNTIIVFLCGVLVGVIFSAIEKRKDDQSRTC